MPQDPFRSHIGSLIAALACVAPLTAQTTLNGDVFDGNGGPLVAGTVYVVESDITIPVGEELQIQPGAIVKFQPDTNLYADGTLTALGTASAPIIFASIKDDAFGGDTNLDGPSEGTPYSWGGVTLSGVGVLHQLDHVEFHHFGDWTLIGFERRGIDIYAPTILTNCLFQDGHNAVRAFGNPTVANTVVESCAGPAFTVARLDAVPGFTDNTATNSGPSSIVVSSNAAVDVDTTITAANQVTGGIIFEATSRVAPSATLTIEAGVNLKFDRNEGLIVDGTLRTVGTETDPIAFTYVNDSSAGGPTSSGGGYSTGPWDRVAFDVGATAELTHTTFNWTQRAHEVGGNAAVDHCTFSAGDNSALRISPTGSLALTNSSVSGFELGSIDGMHIEDLSGFRNNTISGGSLPIVPIGDVSVDTTIVEGALSGTSIQWGGTIHAGATLTIEKGTRLIGSTGIVVDGGLVIDGDAEQPVTYAPFSFAGISAVSRGIIISAGATGPCEIESLRMFNSGTVSDASLANHSPLTTMRDVRIDDARSTAFQLTALAGDLRNCVAFDCALSGFDIRDGDFDVVNCTSVGNAGVGFGALNAFTGTVRNSVAWNNALGNFFKLDAGEVFHSNGSALLDGVDGNIFASPQFVNQASGDLRLASFSPMIDAGEPLGGAQGKDIAGFPRVLDGDIALDGFRRVDLGAHEKSRLILDITDTVVPGDVATIVLTNSALPVVGTHLILAFDELEIPTALGSIFADITGPNAIIAWPDPLFQAPTPFDTVEVTVPVDIPTGIHVVVQAVSFAIGTGNGTVSNSEVMLITE